MDPEAFRLSLNTLVQDLRNVTWLLQKQKNELPDFRQWYPAWQSSVSSDQMMQWIVSARNRVVKIADLEMHSRALARLSRESGDEVEGDMALPPRFTPHQIMSVLLAEAEGRVTSGVLTVERRWVDKELPSVELLDATAYAYDQLVEVVRLAHAAGGVDECDLPARVPDCVTAQLLGGLVCMIAADDSRRLHVDVSSMREMVEGAVTIRRGDLPPEMVRQRYGDFKTPRGDAIARVLPATAMAKRMLAADKSLATLAWLIRADAVVDGMGLFFADDAGIRIGIHRLADRVGRTGADGVLLHAEAWWAPPADPAAGEGARPILPSKRPDRREAIWVIGITRDGRVAQSFTPFSRAADGTIQFGPLQFTGGGFVRMLEPIAQKWREMDADLS
jgi:hypothetical protein